MMKPTSYNHFHRPTPLLASARPLSVKTEQLQIARSFIARSNWRAGLIILRNWFFIFSLVAISESLRDTGFWFLAYALCAWGIGAIQFSIGEVIVHEASHRNLFTRPAWHQYLEFLYSLPFFTTVESYRKEHTTHHQHLGDKEDHIFQDYEQIGLFKEKRNWLWLWIVRPISGYGGLLFAWSVLQRPVLKSLRLISFWLAVIGLCWSFGWMSQLFLYWLLPMVWCFSSFLYWSEVSDHFHCDSGTRSRLGRFGNFIFHNNGFHHLHHTFPLIPFYLLPAAHEALSPYGGEFSMGFLDTYHQLKAKEKRTP